MSTTKSNTRKKAVEPTVNVTVESVELPTGRRMGGGTESPKEKIRIAILGGGVAGLSAAHELAKFANFEVYVFEKDDEVGGKARSQDVQKQLGTNSKTYLGEHGFRLFPHFYKHITQTLKEIPFPQEYANSIHRLGAMDSSVWGNLRGSTEGGYADGRLHKVQRPFPVTASDFSRSVRELVGHGVPATNHDIMWYSWHILKFLTACQERRDEQYDRQTWAEFVGVGTGIYTTDFEAFVRAAPRNLSAMWPDKCSARSCGGTLAQMTFDFSGRQGLNMDAVLTGPTTETWLDAWKLALGKGVMPGTNTCMAMSGFEQVHFLTGYELHGFEFDGMRVSSAIVRRGKNSPYQWLRGTGCPEPTDAVGNPRPVVQDVPGPMDYFVCAVPLEVAQRIFSTEERAGESTADEADALKACHEGASAMAEFDESLRLLGHIEDGTAPMVGLQYFLQRDVQVCHGHVLYSSSPWALTSISQAQFWDKQIDADDLEDYLKRRNIAVEGLQGVLSVIISDWDTVAPRLGRSARECTPREIKREVWLQLREALENSEAKLKDEDLLGWPDDEDEQLAVPMPDTIEAKELEVEQKDENSGWTKLQGQKSWVKLDAVLFKAAHLDDCMDWKAREISFTSPKTKKTITCTRYVPEPHVVRTPLFVHPRGSQALRPDAQLRIPNLLLASDYVRTYTDLATMEAANEAARRAALAILQRETIASPELFPKLWPLTEGQVFEAAKALDRWLYLNGQQHIMDSPQILGTFMGAAFDNVLQTGLDLLGLRNKVGLPPDMARRVIGAARGFGRGGMNPEMLPRLLTFFTSSFLSSIRWD